MGCLNIAKAKSTGRAAVAPNRQADPAGSSASSHGTPAVCRLAEATSRISTCQREVRVKHNYVSNTTCQRDAVKLCYATSCPVLRLKELPFVVLKLAHSKTRDIADILCQGMAMRGERIVQLEAVGRGGM